jgi:MFS family permease
VLLQPMAETLHASTASVTGALTASVLAGGALSVPVGRWLDRHGGRTLMTSGSLLATGLVVAWSQVRTVAQLYAVMIGIGLTTAMVLYEPALTVVVSWFDASRRSRAVLAVIVVAGFASTIFLPLTAVLVDRYGWRTALLVLAAIHGALTVPLHASAVRPPPTLPERQTGATHAGAVRAALNDARFWLLAVAFVAHSAAMAAMTVHLVGFLVHSGHPATFAAAVAGLLGVLSVTGRLLLTAAHRRWRLTTLVVVVFAVQATAAFLLPLVAASPVGAAAGVTAFGIGFGVASLTRPQFLADRYGTVAYGTINGILATPVTVARAVAPMVAAGLLAITNYPAVLAAIGATCLVAAVGIAARAGTPPPVTGPGS